jgi:hypothetical protein
VINHDLYAFMERAAPFLVFWSFAFTLITSVRILLRVQTEIARVPDSMVFTELAGLPLTLLQPVCFVWAGLTKDVLSALLFLWWGPGFVAMAIAVIVAKSRGRTIDWYPWRRLISYLCKGYYLAYAATFLALGMPGMLSAGTEGAEPCVDESRFGWEGHELEGRELPRRAFMSLSLRSATFRRCFSPRSAASSRRSSSSGCCCAPAKPPRAA